MKEKVLNYLQSIFPKQASAETIGVAMGEGKQSAVLAVEETLNDLVIEKKVARDEESGDFSYIEN